MVFTASSTGTADLDSVDSPVTGLGQNWPHLLGSMSVLSYNSVHLLHRWKAPRYLVAVLFALFCSNVAGKVSTSCLSLGLRTLHRVSHTLPVSTSAEVASCALSRLS